MKKFLLTQNRWCVMIVGMVIGLFIGLTLGFITCALLSANKVNGEVYYIDMSKSNSKDEEDSKKGDKDSE